MTPSAAASPITGRTVLACLLGFFAVVAAANLTLAKLAIDSLPGTEVDSAYGASLAYPSEIAAAREQAGRGWTVNAQVMRSADGHADVSVEARDRSGAVIPGLSFAGRLERPADRRFDRAVALAPAGRGTFRGAVAALPPGLWELVLDGEVAGRRVFLSSNRILLP